MPKWLIIAVILYMCCPLYGLVAEKTDHSKYIQHFEKGITSLFQGKNQDAIAAFEAALAVEPKRYELLYYLGVAYAQNQFWNKAVDVYKRSLELKPDNIEGLYSLAIVHFKLNQWENAVEHGQKVIKLYPQHARGHTLLGKVYVKLAKYSEAIDELNKAIALNPNEAGNYYELGNAYLNSKQYNQAIENFTQAIKFGPPHYADPYYGRGTAYLRLGERDKSRNDLLIYQQYQKEYAEYERLTRLTRVDPNNLEGWADLAKILVRQKKYNDVIPVLQKCIELGTSQNASANTLAGFYQGLSQAFINLKYPKHALFPAQKAIQLMPNQALFYNTLGSIHTMLGDVRKALPAFRKAVELDSEQPYYHLNLSKIYENLGNRKLAQEHYQAYEFYLSKQKKTK